METASYICSLPPSSFLFLSQNVPSLVYYSHVPTIIVSVFLAVYVLIGDPRSIFNRVFFGMLSVFALWLTFNLVFWASNRGDVIMFAWSMAILFEPLIYIGALYLVYLLISGRDVPFNTKIVWLALYAPLIVLVPTKYILTGFNVTDCIATESVVSWYSYGIEVVFVLWLLDIFQRSYRAVSGERTPFILFVSGLAAFLLLFTFGNIFGSVTDNWNIAQVGVAGAYIFFGACLYVFVQYNLFKIRVLAAEAIVASFSFLVFSLIFLRHLEFFQRFFIFVTFLFCLIVGYLFVKISKRQVQLVAELEHQKRELEDANTQLQELGQFQSEFASIVTHQVVTPLTGIKGYVSMMQEDGQFFEHNKNHILNALDRLTGKLTGLLTDFVSLYRIGSGKKEQGHVTLDELIDSIEKTRYKEKVKQGVSFSCTKEVGESLRISTSVLEVVENILKCSVRDTVSGYVRVSVELVDCRLNIIIKDTAVRNLPVVSTDVIRRYTKSGSEMETNLLGNNPMLVRARQILEQHEGSLQITFNEGETIFTVVVRQT